MLARERLLARDRARVPRGHRVSGDRCEPCSGSLDDCRVPSGSFLHRSSDTPADWSKEPEVRGLLGTRSAIDAGMNVRSSGLLRRGSRIFAVIVASCGSCLSVPSRNDPDRQEVGIWIGCDLDGGPRLVTSNLNCGHRAVAVADDVGGLAIGSEGDPSGCVFAGSLMGEPAVTGVVVRLNGTTSLTPSSATAT